MPNHSHPSVAHPAGEQNRIAPSGKGGASELLPQNESLYSKLVNSLGGIVWEADGKTFQFTFVSPQAERILGYPVEQWLNEPDFWRKHTHPEDADWCAAYYLDATGQHRGHEFKYRMIAADGRVVWLQDIVSAKLEADGSVRLRGIMIDITERKRANEALVESENRFRTTFENSGSGMALVDMQGHPIECNPALQKLLGYTDEELSGMAFTEFTHVDDRELDWGLYNELVAGKRDKYEIEKRFIRKDGRVIWGNLIVSLIRDGEGAPKYAVGMLQDITERKRAEEELHKSEAELRLAADGAGIGMWYWDEAAKDLTYDRKTNALFGLPAEKKPTVEEFFDDILHPDDRDEVYRVWREAIESATEFQMAYRVRWPDGSIHWIAARGRSYYDETGSPTQMVGIVFDITKRKQAEEEMRRVSERLQLATRAAGIGIWDWDVVQDKLVWDDANYGLFGVRKEDFGGAYDAWAGTLAPEDFERITADVRAALRGEREYDTEFRVVWPDGSVHYLKADGQVFWDEAGRPLRMVGVNYDITERKQAEEVAKAGEERLSLAFEAAGIGTGELDLQSNQVSLSHPMQRVLGLAPGTDNLTFEEYVELIHPEDRASVSQAVENAIADRTDIALDYRIVWPEGTVHWVTSRARVFYDEAGRATRIIGAIMDITERKEAERELRLSEERFAKAFHASPEASTIHRHRDGVFLEVNERWLSIYGYTREEVIGRSTKDMRLSSPEVRDRLRRTLEEQGSLRDYEIALTTKQGEIRQVSLSAEMFVINGETCSIYLQLDITERKRAEEENRRLIHSLGERVKELTALHHTARVLQDESKSLPELLQEVVELLPPAWQYPEVTAACITFGEMEFKTGNYAQTCWSQSAEFMADGVRGVIEVVYLEERPEEYAGPFLLEEKNLIDSLAEMLGSALDRRRAQEALGESEHRFRQLTDNIREVLWLYTPDYDKVLYISPAYERVWGLTRESLCQDPYSFLDAVHPDDRARVEETVRRDRRRGFNQEYRVVRPDGTVRWIWSRGFPIEDEAGRVYRIAGIEEDITERKEAEEQLKTSSRQLRALSESLRRAKEEEGIRIARELHDELGSALTSMKWSLLELDKVGPEGGRPVGNAGAREKIAEMVGLVDATINTVRRISSELRPGVLDDLGLVSAIEWHAQQFQERTGIVCRFDSLIENVELNREQSTTVFRIFQEAMTNVLRHARATKVNIIIEEDEGEIVLEIRDNGRGITETERLGVHSLGLLGMRERAHSIGGKVEINGIAGKGTVLVVRLPIKGDATI